MLKMVLKSPEPSPIMTTVRRLTSPMDTKNEEGFVRRIRIRDLGQGSSRAVYP